MLCRAGPGSKPRARACSRAWRALEGFARNGIRIARYRLKDDWPRVVAVPHYRPH
ncbi:hypothetical protein BD309DRAFT_971194 [Dichomitus squalens]|nr:hypothetical protein BD309DRAFT_971194 [Dichomitus squalens]